MSDYTPSTEEVRANYLPPRTEIQDADEQFDRWLAEVKAQAWEEGYTQGNNDMYDGDFPPPNPYRQQTH